MKHPVNPEILFNYTPALFPFPPPDIQTACDRPLVCPVFSAEYIPYLVGLLEIYAYPDKFIGTEDERQHGVDMMTELRRILMTAQNCGCEDVVTLHRFNPETGRPEISTDGGSTWTPDPEDPQNSVPLYPPPVQPGGSRTKCDAATNAKEHIEDLITGIHDNLSVAATIFDLAVGVAVAILAIVLSVITGGVGSPEAIALAEAIWGAAAAVFALGITAFDDYWTNELKDRVLCALYCTIGENGQFTDAQFAQFKAKVREDLPASPALDIVLTTINGVGSRGLSQMASYGAAADSDCSDCDCVGCDFSTWAIWVAGGTLVSQDHDHITLTLTDGGDGWFYGSVKSAAPSQCCCNVVINPDDGQSFAPIGANPCGSQQVDESTLDFSSIGGTHNAFAFKSHDAGNVTITSTGDCE